MRSVRGWVAVALVGAAIFGLSFALRPFDSGVGLVLVGSPGLVKPAGALAFLGGLSFIAPAMLLALGIMAYFRLWWGMLRLAAGVGLADVTTRLLKEAFHRPRPEYALVDAGGFGFPSGHATVGASLALLAIWFASGYFRGRIAIAAILILAGTWGALMALSRLV